MEEQNRSLIKVNSSLLAALSKGGLNIDVFAKDILVLECIVAGTSFRKLDDVEKDLGAEVKLVPKREPDNKHDKFAIALYFNKTKVGYIPRDKNEVIARLMDAGKKFFVTIQAREWEGNWLRIEIKVFLKD
ncbi:MAG: HIRAN domain-containing protein [Chitinophagales bacterium]|nr:HIRAN domain-containing protein [Chitinophagales bacterium]